MRGRRMKESDPQAQIAHIRRVARNAAIWEHAYCVGTQPGGYGTKGLNRYQRRRRAQRETRDSTRLSLPGPVCPPMRNVKHLHVIIGARTCPWPETRTGSRQPLVAKTAMQNVPTLVRRPAASTIRAQQGSPESRHELHSTR